MGAALSINSKWLSMVVPPEVSRLIIDLFLRREFGLR